jgi:PAS domain S-box-containing protein
MRNLFKTKQVHLDQDIGKQKAGVLCYIIGMVVILSLYRLMISLVTQLHLFTDIIDYQHHVQVSATILLILMMGLVWMAYRQWQNIMHEHEQLEAILGSIGPDMLIAIDRNNRILRCGGAIEEMSGYTPVELIGEKADLLYHDRRSGGQSFEIQSAISRNGFHVGYATGCTKDDEDYLLEIQTSPLTGPNGGAVLLLRNLDERQQARVQLQRRIRMEEIFAAVSTEFLSTEPDLFGNACESALKQIAEVFGQESACVGFIDPASKNPPTIQSWQRNGDVMDPTLINDLIRATEPLKENDAIAYAFPADDNTAPKHVVALHKKWALRSVVLLPMRLHKEPFGFLALFSKEPRRRNWAQEDTTLLQAITSTFMSGKLNILTKELLQKTNDSAIVPQPPPSQL